MWLCGHCGVDPVSLGWRSEVPVRSRWQQGPANPTGSGPGLQQTPPVFELFWHGNEYDRELRSWLVKDLILETGQGLASGQWGTAKTFVARSCRVIMTVTAFAGREVVRHGGVVFIAAEGAMKFRSG